MPTMAKDRGDQPASDPAIKSRRKKASSIGSNSPEPFVRAFADALRDILHDEMRPML